RVTGRRHGPIIAGGAAAPDPPLPARSAGSPTMRCGPMASSSQPGGAEQPDLVPLLVVLLEAEPAGWTWQQGPGQRASPAGGTGPGQSPASAGSRTARTVPARPARQASPLG